MANALAYGFVGLQHLFDRRLDDVNTGDVVDAINQSAAEHSRQLAALVGTIAQPTTLAMERFRQPGSGTLQPLDEWGNPRLVRDAAYYDVAYPIRGGGTAFGDNRITRAYMTVEEVNEYMVSNQNRDADWIRRHALAALFTNSTWTFEDERNGSLTIQPLANSDSVVYVTRAGSTATDDHYLAQSASIDDANNPFPDIRRELNEHPGNTGPYVVYAPTNLISSIEALSNFNEASDPNIRAGTSSDELVGSIDLGIGHELIGYVDGCWIIEYDNLPDNYMIAQARGAEAPLAMREHEPPGLQGLITEMHSPDGNLMETRMLRFAGFGARNRTAALIYQIGSATYSIPTGYSQPLAV